MKILITGCAGMIGSYLTSDLLRTYPKESGHKIVGIDNLSRGKIINLKEACGTFWEDLKFIEADLSNFDQSWVNELRNCDLIIHLADVVAGICYVFSNESLVFRTNLIINSNVSKAIYNSPPKRYIYIGTACSFPKNLQLSTNSRPLIEEDQFPALPESGYGWSKLMGEIESNYLAELSSWLDELCPLDVFSLSDSIPNEVLDLDVVDGGNEAEMLPALLQEVTYARGSILDSTAGIAAAVRSSIKGIVVPHPLSARLAAIKVNLMN